MSNLNTRLRMLRKECGLSQQEIANRLSLTKSSVNMYERGEREPGIDVIELLADFFKVDVDFLIGKSEIRRKNHIEFTPDDENPWELELLTAFAALDIDQQIKVVRQVNALAADSNHEFKLTPEGSIMIGKLTGKEVDLIVKYREKEELQAAVDKLLDVKDI